MTHHPSCGRCPGCLYRNARRDARAFPMFVVYDHPLDHPEHVVMRMWLTDRPTLAAWTYDELDEARQAVPRGLVRLPRAPEDDAKIVEVWL